MCWLIVAEIYGLTVSPSGSTGKKICVCYCNGSSHSAQWLSHLLKLPQLRAHSALPAAWMTATFEVTTMSSRGLFWSLPEKMLKMLWEQREDNPLFFTLALYKPELWAKYRISRYSKGDLSSAEPLPCGDEKRKSIGLIFWADGLLSS